MIIKEFYGTRSDGVRLVRTFSDTGNYIEREGKTYEEAIDPESLERVYSETDIPIPKPPFAEVSR